MTSVPTEACRATADVGPLVAFRLSGLRGRSTRAVLVGAVLGTALTCACAIGPASLGGAGTSGHAAGMLQLLPVAYLAFLVTTTFTIIGAGGGRELLPRDEAVAFPVSTTTDHLGALMLVPLNIAWIIQAWSLLGLTAYASGAQNLWAVQITTLVWLFFSTALAQVIAWSVEGVRRRRHGTWLVRGVGAVLALAAVSMLIADRAAVVLDQSPTLAASAVALDGGKPAGLGPSALRSSWQAVSSRLWSVPSSPTWWPDFFRARSLRPRDELSRCAPWQAPSWQPWSAPTGQVSGARCRCAAAFSSWPSCRVWSLQRGSSSGRCCRSFPVSWLREVPCCSVSTHGRSTA
ncbi:MAG: hypothetical protein WKF73_04115 [Nocardioidaceae bacterium]